jgi:dTDP-4-amino-4,6-dideoxygalactose transaminase
MRSTFLPFGPPSIGPQEIEAVLETMRSGWITTGPKVVRFEEAFARRLGAAGAVAVSSCTAGLHTGLAVMGIGHGDAVITTPLTFAGTANAIEHVGARPVFVDVEPDTLNLAPDGVARALATWNGAETIRAVLPVHYGGHPCDLSALRELAVDHGLAVVEDAAHALPARIGESEIGGARALDVPWVTSFSFYATKNLTTGEGGMLTGPSDLLAAARVFSRHGLSEDAWNRRQGRRGWRYEVVAPGHKFNMTDIQAAIGLVQLDRLGAFHTRRSAIAARYSAAFAEHPSIERPAVRPGYTHAWHLYPIRLATERLRIDRDDFIERLAARNVGASVHYIPVHLHPYYRDRYGYAPDAFPVTLDASRRLVSLPIYPRMSEADVEDVIAAVLDIVREHKA